MAQTRAVIDVVRPDRAAKHPHDQVVLLVGTLRRRETGEGIGAACRLDPQQLLRRQLQRVVPGRLAERRVPVLRRRHAIADVQIEPFQQRERAHRLAGGTRWCARLGAAALSLDGAPGTGAPLRAFAAFPDPPSGFLDPAPADQRFGQAIAMLREVVTETPLHASRSLVGRVQFDVGGRDPNEGVTGDVQIDLATDAAVGADRPHDLLGVPDLLGREALARHHLEDRARRADANTLATPGTPRFVGVAVRAHDDLGMLAAEAHVQHADDLDVLAGAHAARAQDAGRHVVPDHRIAGPLVARAQRQVAIHDRARHHVVLHEVALELVPRVRATTVSQVIGRIPLREEPQHALAVLDRRVRLRRNDHLLGDFRRARGDEFGLALDGDQTDAAVADDGELGIPAEGRDLDAGRSSGIEDSLVRRGGNGPSVDQELRHVLITTSICDSCKGLAD